MTTMTQAVLVGVATMTTTPAPTPGPAPATQPTTPAETAIRPAARRTTTTPIRSWEPTTPAVTGIRPAARRTRTTPIRVPAPTPVRAGPRPEPRVRPEPAPRAAAAVHSSGQLESARHLPLNGSGMIGALKVIGGVLAALVLLGIAVWVSHDWDPKSGIAPLYVILALGAVALAFPAPREWLRNVTKISLGGIEVTRQVEDAVAAASALPVTDEDADTESRRKFKIIGEDWRKDPGGTLATLQVKLDERLHWLEREIYATHISSGTKTIEKLRASGLI